MSEQKRFYWQPLPLMQLLSVSNFRRINVVLPLFCWALIIVGGIFALHFFMPASWLIYGNKGEVTTYFIFLPYFSIGLLLLFWAGFEWGFIPVFISAFAVAFNSGIDVTWALLYGFSFVLGLALFGVAYQSLRVPYDLRGLKSISFFISIAFIASLASSMGGIIWGLAHDMGAYPITTVWKSWWTGIFFQMLIITGPLLYLFTPTVERLKEQYYDIAPSGQVSINWVYGTVMSITLVLVLFVLSGQWLGHYRLQEVLLQLSNVLRGDILGAIDPFEIITWLSIGLILLTGAASIYLIGQWNRELQEKVEKQTEQLRESRARLSKSLKEKKLMLRETHHRVKNNLAQVQGLLHLQKMHVDDPVYSQLIEDSSSRIHSMALIHKALYDTEQYDSISLASYLRNLTRNIHNSFASEEATIDLAFDLEDYTVNITQAVPLGLIITEILINAYKYAFRGKEQGQIHLSLNQAGDKLRLCITDDGIGLPEDAMDKTNSLGMQLIYELSNQIEADLTVSDERPGTCYELLFDQEKV